jgi:hypothetical protein
MVEFIGSRERVVFSLGSQCTKEWKQMSGIHCNEIMHGSGKEEQQVN